MKEYEIWMAGYRATGQYAPHEYIGKATADSFKEACKIAIKNWLSNPEDYKYYNEEYCHFWGCNLYDNEKDAERSFG